MQSETRSSPRYAEPVCESHYIGKKKPWFSKVICRLPFIRQNRTAWTARFTAPQLEANYRTSLRAAQKSHKHRAEHVERWFEDHEKKSRQWLWTSSITKKNDPEATKVFVSSFVVCLFGSWKDRRYFSERYGFGGVRRFSRIPKKGLKVVEDLHSLFSVCTPALRAGLGSTVIWEVAQIDRMKTPKMLSWTFEKLPLKWQLRSNYRK